MIALLLLGQIMLKKRWHSFLFLLGCLPLFLSAEIKQVDSLKNIASTFEKLNQDDLVVLDIDEVIFTDQDAILRPEGDLLRAQIFNERYILAKNDKDKKAVAAILTLPLFLAKKQLVEPCISELILDLQKRNIKVIALTSYPTSLHGMPDNLEKSRLNHLTDFGIEFKNAFPEQTRLVLKRITSVQNQPPVYDQGVLFTNGHSKAEVLIDFFNHMRYKPKKVIFIDDMYIHLQQMESKLKARKIDYLGYYYIRVKKDPKLFVDEKLARFQFDYLFEHRQWLDDQAAAQEMSKSQNH